jgi:hypothetical protein
MQDLSEACKFLAGLNEKSPPDYWLSMMQALFNDVDYSQLEELREDRALLGSAALHAVQCIQHRRPAYILALEFLLLLISTGNKAEWWHETNCHQVLVGVALVGNPVERILAAKCLKALCTAAAMEHVSLHTLHQGSVTEWALAMLHRHAGKHDRADTFASAVGVLHLLLLCKAAREQILSSAVPAALQSIQSACRLSPASVDAYSNLLQSMQQWLLCPRRPKRTLRIATPVTAAQAGKAFHHLQAMALDTKSDFQDAISSTNAQHVTISSELPLPKSDCAESSQQLKDLRDAGLDVDALPPSLLHLFMDQGDAQDELNSQSTSGSDSPCSIDTGKSPREPVQRPAMGCTSGLVTIK